MWKMRAAHPAGAASAGDPRQVLVAGEGVWSCSREVLGGEVLQVELHVHALPVVPVGQSHVVRQQRALQLVLGQNRRVQQEPRHVCSPSAPLQPRLHACTH